MDTSHGRMSLLFLLLLSVGMIGACSDSTTAPAEDIAPAFTRTAGPGPDGDHIRTRLHALNQRLALEGAPYAVARVELSLAPNANPASPGVVFALDRTLRLTSRWVPGDARRLADGSNITYASFAPLMVANGAGPVSAAADAAFSTWNVVSCSNLPLVRRTLAPNVFPGALFALPGFVNDPLAADVATIGFLPGAFFDLFLGPGASTEVLGVTFTFVFIDGNGDPTDIDFDGRDDTALKEIWYNNTFEWSTTGGGDADVETTMLHEDGHALELDHFGRVAVNTKTGQLIVSPRAVMNRFILGVLRTPLGTDVGGYCGNFSSWPD